MPPNPPSLPHALHTYTYSPPPPIIHTISFAPPPLGKKLKETLPWTSSCVALEEARGLSCCLLRYKSLNVFFCSIYPCTPFLLFLFPFHTGICTYPMQVVRTGRNNLNNRFLPFESIQTDAVFSLDDDQEAPHSAIEFAFRSAPSSHSQ